MNDNEIKLTVIVIAWVLSESAVIILWALEIINVLLVVLFGFFLLGMTKYLITKFCT